MSFIIAWSYLQTLLRNPTTTRAPETMSIVSWAYAWSLLGVNYILLYFNYAGWFEGLFATIPEVISGLVTLHFVAIALYSRALYAREPLATHIVRATEVALRVVSTLYIVTAWVLLRAFPEAQNAEVALTTTGFHVPDTFLQIWMVLTALGLTVLMPRTRSHIVLFWAGVALLVGSSANALGYHEILLPSALGAAIGWAGSLIGIMLVAFRGFFIPPSKRHSH
jgi:hypothetical protein